MIGWDSVLSRDYEEAVVNGQVDSDLERMAGAIQQRQLAIKYPPCPECGLPLQKEHVHTRDSGNGTGFNISIKAF